MNHISHKDHPLELIEDLENIAGVVSDGGGGDQKQIVICCFACREPLSNGLAYGCIQCHHFLHKTCAEIDPTKISIDFRREIMEEMNHILHKDHPLKFFENLEMIIGVGGDGNDEKEKVICCYGCQEPISGGSAYGCIVCHYFLHKTCAQLDPTINIRFHAHHPLMLIDKSNYWYCDVCCLHEIKPNFGYHCYLCNFGACLNCVVGEFAREFAIAAIKEEAFVKLEHEGHPQHTLTLQLRPAAFRCDACNVNDEDLFYQCDNCDFWIHKTCASLAPTIDLLHHHKHPLILVYFLPDKFYNYTYYCEFCNKMILQSDWTYHCPNCRYFSHIKCALNAEEPSTPRDGISDVKEQVNEHDFLQFPMKETFTDPLKLLNFEKIALDDNDTIEINHWSHDHPLILNVEPQGDNIYDINCNDPIKVCYGCVRPLSFPYYSCKDGCSFTLHKYCAKLPHTSAHQLHPDHLLNLVDFEDPKFIDYKCTSCLCFGNTFVYKCEACKFYLDVNCAFLPNTIKHERHKHPLVQVIDPKRLCKACDKRSVGTSYVCKACDFQLGLFCAMRSPHSITHRHCKGHPVPLVYPPVEDHPEDFYCDICEKEMHPKFWLYYCHECDSTFHLGCIGANDWSENHYAVSTITVRYHKHPLTYVRRKKTPRYVCLGCNRDINGILVLECRTGTCPFRICRYCHVKKR